MIVAVYCRNGHRIGLDVIWDAGAGTGDYCPDCRVSLDVYRHVPDPPLWPVVLVVLVTLVLVGAWWWWMWLAPL